MAEVIDFPFQDDELLVETTLACSKCGMETFFVLKGGDIECATCATTIPQSELKERVNYE